MRGELGENALFSLFCFIFFVVFFLCFVVVVVVVFSSSFSILSAPDYKVGMQQTST